MKVYKILAASALSAILTASATFALPVSSSFPDSLNQAQFVWENAGMNREQVKDPIQRLLVKKAKIEAQLAQGKISKAEAEAKIVLIDAKIKRIQEFNKLPLSEKKERLVIDFKAFVDEKVKEGKLTQEKAKELIAKYTRIVNEWNGSGNPPRMGKGSGHHKEHDKRMKDRAR